ncbi:protein OCTOPUS-like [Carex rostrata]
MDPPRRSGATSCDLHPHDDAFSGSFCPSCLRDRLAGLDASASPSSVPAPGRRSTSSLRVRSLFSQRPSIPSSSASASASASSAHLRRCKSFSLSHPPDSGRGRGSTIHEEEEDLKPMKIHLDLESHSHSRPRHSTSIPSNSNSNFLIRKWHQWRGKHIHRKQQHCTNNLAAAPPMPLPHLVPHGPTITGSRRSCDTEPRFSVDAGRISFDCPPRFSFDEPRASWDGYSASARPINYSRFHPVLSAADCALDPSGIRRYDDQIPVEDESAIPGSQAQTRDYYLDSSSSSRRRRSFERSASMRKGPQPELEIDAEHRSIPAFNSKVSPAGGAEFYHYHHAIATRDGDGMSGSFSSVFQDPCKSQIAEKKPKKWTKGWNLWGLIQKKGNSKDQSANTNHVSSNHPEHFMRCNSSISARSSFSSYNATGGSMRRNSVDMININSTHTNTNNGYSKKRRDEFVLERNRSARFSPGRVDNSMLRFYLTPMMGNQSGRRSSGVRPVSTGSQSLSARPVHRLY